MIAAAVSADANPQGCGATLPVVDIEALSFQRGGFVIELPRLRLMPGETIGLVGPSGCGKSTVIDLLALLRRPSTATRFGLLGRDAAALWNDDHPEARTALRGRHLGVVLQTGGLLPSLPLLDNLMLPLRLLGRDDPPWVRHLLDVLDLNGLQTRRPAQLSVGQRQRLAIARALAHRPALVLADEPTASLGARHGPPALDLLLELTRSCATALVVVSHDLALLRSRGLALLACEAGPQGVRLAPAS